MLNQTFSWHQGTIYQTEVKKQMLFAAVNWTETIDLLLGLLPVVIILGIVMLFLSMFGFGKN